MSANEKSRPGRRRVFLMRHGDVDYFDGQGNLLHADTVALNAAGRAQAEAAARVLAAVPLDRVVASDLVRSVETAAVVTAGRGLIIETRPGLREIQMGRLGDVPADALEAAVLGAFTDNVTAEGRFLGGETFGGLRDRVVACLGELLADRGWRCLLLVAHGGVNRALLSHALGVALQGFAALEQDPGCINILDVDEAGRWLVRLVNHTPYDPAKEHLELTTMERLLRDYRARRARP
jgi:probable phosphoglycerate mutase